MLKVLTKWHMQTVQTQIRLLQEQSDQGLHCLPFHLSILRNNCIKSKSNAKVYTCRLKCLKLGHLYIYVWKLDSFSIVISICVFLNAQYDADLHSSSLQKFIIEAPVVQTFGLFDNHRGYLCFIISKSKLNFASWVKISADNILKYFSYFFSKKTGSDNSCKLSTMDEMSNPVFWES